MHAFNPSTWEAEADRFLSSRTARATQRNPVSKNQIQKKKKRIMLKPGMGACALIPSAGEAEAGGFLSSRTARATQRNPVSEKPNPKKKENSDRKGA